MTNHQNITKSKRNLNIVLSTMFSLFAIIQLNDPDPTLWFSLYMIVALVSIISNYTSIHRIIIWVLIIGYSLYASRYFFYFFDWLNTEHKEEIFGKMVYEKPYLEGSREFIGLIMAIGALFFQVGKKDTH
ncbi:hypothetical protein APS56_03200 [Pseudalgibacter alginicilyticus]|uniref:Transmembrane family 220, helix n=1 Tax=Pseudalgibacter alginicilyticus TaxID=1736674 RepID=A0A0P0CDT6_9FLAO|nr:transmembrane 220 family protein [Pseudalgibacter alginicilyticus]ALJ04212.1 hypothetical protein APS56_03200 [Pseudalgibacter alginicilyticus]